ncbi:LysR family transcriptional regulator [Halomonas sp. HMF6819]|uniref:LysR family transcriptional regulator n=1 Tax=unclassified Halomonas TaxID=2609666 RepID=UPI002076B7AA|nr:MULTISPECIES: LysR family transcriptional regulator [unclassified Halomonas]
MYDFDELNAFSDVMATGSLTRSAQRMGVAKSTLSRRISQLESRLNQPLLRRQANQLTPTEAGLLFHGYCTELLTLARQSQEALSELREEISGKITLEVHGALARNWVSKVVDTFLDRHPGIELTLQSRERPSTTLQTNSVHIWLGALDECGLNQERLGQLTRGLYASPRYLAQAPALTHPSDLDHHAWIDLLDTDTTRLPLYHASAPEYVFSPPRSRLRVDQTLIHVDAIANGQGIGLLPHWIVHQREMHHPGELVPCLAGWEPQPLPVSMLYAFGHHSRRVSALLGCLREHVPHQWQAPPLFA